MSQSPRWVVYALIGFASFVAILVLGPDVLERHNAVLTAIATAVIALFTIVLAVETSVQVRTTQESLRLAGEAANAAKKSADVARDEFVLVHRPNLVLRRERLYEKHGTYGINFVLANTGGLPATDIRGNLNIQVIPMERKEELTKDSMPSYGSHWLNVGKLVAQTKGSEDLAGGQRAFIYFMDEQLNAQVVHQVEHGFTILVFFGVINWKDPAGSVREAGFYRTYMQGTGRFAYREDDPDYEYSK
jgi:hypothetical protein